MGHVVARGKGAVVQSLVVRLLIRVLLFGDVLERALVRRKVLAHRYCVEIFVQRMRLVVSHSVPGVRNRLELESRTLQVLSLARFRVAYGLVL